MTFHDIKETFGLNHIRLGSWVEEDEKRKAANLIFDSLADIPSIKHPLNQRLERVFATTFLTHDGQNSHEYVDRAVALDHQYGRQYFSNPTELMARAFEACIESYPEISNQYLVNETLSSKLADAGGYPAIVHRQQIFSALIEYFEPLGEALGRE